MPTIKKMDMECTTGRSSGMYNLVTGTMDSGEMMKCKEKVDTTMQMEINMLENLKMAKKMGKV